MATIQELVIVVTVVLLVRWPTLSLASGVSTFFYPAFTYTRFWPRCAPSPPRRDAGDSDTPLGQFANAAPAAGSGIRDDLPKCWRADGDQDTSLNFIGVCSLDDASRSMWLTDPSQGNCFFGKFGTGYMYCTGAMIRNIPIEVYGGKQPPIKKPTLSPPPPHHTKSLTEGSISKRAPPGKRSKLKTYPTGKKAKYEMNRSMKSITGAPRNRPPPSVGPPQPPQWIPLSARKLRRRKPSFGEILPTNYKRAPTPKNLKGFSQLKEAENSVSGNGEFSLFTVFEFKVAQAKAERGFGLAYFLCSDLSPVQESYQHPWHFGLFPGDGSDVTGHTIFAIEFDTFKDTQVNDIDDNHVAINVNSAKSIVSRSLKDLNIDMMNTILSVWVDLDSAANYIDVRIGTQGPGKKPADPFISVPKCNVRNLMAPKMYGGFAAAGVTQWTQIFSWSMSTSPNGPPRQVVPPDDLEDSGQIPPPPSPPPPPADRKGNPVLPPPPSPPPPSPPPSPPPPKTYIYGLSGASMVEIVLAMFVIWCVLRCTRHGRNLLRKIFKKCPTILSCCGIDLKMEGGPPKEGQSCVTCFGVSLKIEKTPGKKSCFGYSVKFKKETPKKTEKGEADADAKEEDAKGNADAEGEGKDAKGKADSKSKESKREAQAKGKDANIEAKDAKRKARKKSKAKGEPKDKPEKEQSKSSAKGDSKSPEPGSPKS